MKTKFVGLLVVAILMAISLFAESKIIHVPADYPTIQEGIDAAIVNDIVLVADGTYTGDGNKNLDFNGKAITVRSENGPESTIIDCEGSGKGFYFHSHESIAAKVKGFTITNGDSSGIYCDNSSPLIEENIITNNSPNNGGGIYCKNSSPIIQNNKITYNSANQNGGGISCYSSSSPLIENNEIMNNSANQNGGGIHCASSSPTIRNNKITYNSTNSDGGGIYCTSSSPLIEENIITYNSASSGGGIYCTSSSPLIEENIITYNSANQNGGGIYCTSSSPTIQNNEITYNSANSAGGGIHCNSSSPTIQNNEITNNPAFDGGGIYCYSSSPDITNNAITRNEANYGGGISVENSSAPSIINSTIARNLAQYGGGIYCDSSSPTVLNTILYFNRALVSGDEIYLSGGSITVTYSDIAGGWEGESNIDENPLFVGFRDYHLQAGSLCIDAGTPDGAPPDDIEGNPRDEYPDMGAYEFQGDILGAINGTVTDKDTGEPIVKAIVIAVNIETKEKSKTVTNGNGNYEIADLQPGIYLVICIKKGYNPGIGKVVVEAGKTTTRDFELVPK